MTSKGHFNPNIFYLSAIILLGLVLRLYSLNTLPPSLNWDEVSHGYNAYSILKSGKDEWGMNLPMIFRAYGDYKLPVYIYITAVSEMFFGLSAFAVRLPSVLAGVSLIIFTYLLSKKILKSEPVSVIAALLVAIEPWSLFLSRAALEANVASGLITAGVYFLLVGIKQKSKALLLGILLLGLSVWTYNSARVFVPLLLLAGTLIYKTEFVKIAVTRKKLFSGYVLLGALFIVPMLFQLFNPVGQARYEKISILDQGAINEIVTARNSSQLPGFAARAIHNKATYLTTTFLRNYLSHFSPNFLYIAGGDHYQFNVQMHGLLYILGFPFLLVGLVKLIRTKSWILIIWLFVAPIAASITRESPHTLRSIVMLPIPMVFTAYGFVSVIEKFKKHKVQIITVFGFLLCMSFIRYLDLYTTHYRTEYSQAWQYGYQEAVVYAKQNYTGYDNILFTKYYGEPHEFVLFYWPWDPNLYRSDPNLVRFQQSDWYWVDAFDNFYFFNDWEVPQSNDNWILESEKKIELQGKSMLITRPGNYPEGWRHLKTIYFLDSSPAFDILER